MKTVLHYVLMIILMVYVLFPFAWMLSSSFKPEQEIRSVTPTIVPKEFTFSHYYAVLFNSSFVIYFKNSLVVCLLTTAISVVVGVIASYSLSRFRNVRGISQLGSAILVSQMIPGVLLIIPLYMFMMRSHLLNTHLSLILSYLTFTIPISTWLLKGYFDGIPTELEECAMVDGCRRIETLFRIIIPISLPGILAAASSAFIFSWIEFLFSFTFIDRGQLLTIPPGLAQYQGIWVTNWGGLMAASVLAIVPVLLAFIYFQKFLVSGLTGGALKG
jgi:multiple sugar transport system permease protein